MAELRAYALAVAEVRGLVGATGARAGQVRALADQAFGTQPRPSAVRDRLGPIHRRVPGAAVVRADDPTPGDLEGLLTGPPVPADRAGATWRLVEALVAGLAWSSCTVADPGLPVGLLAPVGLALPPLDGLTVGWCAPAAAAAVPGLHGWLGGSDTWTRAAANAGRPRPDVIVLARH